MFEKTGLFFKLFMNHIVCLPDNSLGSTICCEKNEMKAILKMRIREIKLTSTYTKMTMYDNFLPCRCQHDGWRSRWPALSLISMASNWFMGMSCLPTSSSSDPTFPSSSSPTLAQPAAAEPSCAVMSSAVPTPPLSCAGLRALRVSTLAPPSTPGPSACSSSTVSPATSPGAPVMSVTRSMPPSGAGRGQSLFECPDHSRGSLSACFVWFAAC